MGFYKNIGSPFTELKIKDFEPPYPGGLPECYYHYGENCHLKYYGRDFYFRLRIPEVDKRIDGKSTDLKTLKDDILYTYFMTMSLSGSNTSRDAKPACDRCIFLNPGREKSGIHCLLRRGNSQYRCNRCVFMYTAYFEPLDLAKDA